MIKVYYESFFEIYKAEKEFESDEDPELHKYMAWIGSCGYVTRVWYSHDH